MQVYKDKYDFYYYDACWQTPVITEYQIFKNFFKNKDIPYNYIAFPWASLIDNVWTRNYDELENVIKNFTVDNDKTYFTVIQHIRFREHLDMLLGLNIKYIFTTHKQPDDYKLEEQYNIKILALPLFPKQNNNLGYIQEISERPFLCSFVGQTDNKANLSDIRKKIVEFLVDKSDCLIIPKDKWHYNDAVYASKTISKVQQELIDNDAEYKSGIMDSKFSLCPSGTGPNTIRIWESMSFGTIPVILADTLVLPTLKNVNYSECFVIWKENEIESLYDYLANFEEEKLSSMSKKCVELYNKYFSEEMMHSCILEYSF